MRLCLSGRGLSSEAKQEQSPACKLGFITNIRMTDSLEPGSSCDPRSSPLPTAWPPMFWKTSSFVTVLCSLNYCTALLFNCWPFPPLSSLQLNDEMVARGTLNHCKAWSGSPWTAWQWAGARQAGSVASLSLQSRPPPGHQQSFHCRPSAQQNILLTAEYISQDRRWGEVRWGGIIALLWHWQWCSTADCR